MDPRELERTLDGKLPAYAWPGGYTLIYLTADGNDLCADCATLDLDDQDSYDPPINVDVYWEGPDTYCDECGKVIPSSYGDPDEPDA